MAGESQLAAAGNRVIPHGDVAARLAPPRLTPGPSEADAVLAMVPVEFVSVILPCLNEEDAVAATVADAQRGLAAAGVRGEILVADNGSTDRSVERAIAAGAVVVTASRRGYGAAIQAGIDAAQGDVIVVADADQTYDLACLGDMIAPIRTGTDLVIGARTRGTISPGAMPTLHRYVGTPVLTRLLSGLIGTPLADSQSGFRAFRREAVAGLALRAKGMEYASEMVLRAGRAGLAVTEVPVNYRVRVGESKLSPFGDGWRHLRLLLLLSPHVSLVLPGVVAMCLGVVLCAVSLIAPTGLALGSVRWLPVFLGPMLVILGSQAVLLGALAAHRSPLTPAAIRRRLRGLGQPNAMNRLLGAFAAVALLGLAIDAVLLGFWLAGETGPSLLGVAGLAQALVVVGGCGIATLFAVDYARDVLDW